MCDPISIGVALAAAGTAAQYAGNQQAKRATNQRLDAESLRQKAKTEEQQGLLDQSYNAAQKLKAPAETQAVTDKNKAAFIAALNSAPQTQGYLPGSDNAPKVVADNASKANSDQRAFSEQQANAMADLRSFGDQMLDTNIALGRSGQGIGQLARDKVRSADALNAELRAAAFKGQGLRNFGSLAQMVGMAALTGGLAGGSGGAGAATNTMSTPITVV